MSKKKAFSGSTMTLKDFHGGSIPSDLPLPSAPGVTPRTTDRGAHERPMGGGLGRQDFHRSRPASAGGSVRGLEDVAPFLSRIGRNFDEDERKPFDASSTPRRTIQSIDDSRSNKPFESRPQINQFSPAPARPESSPAVQISAGISRNISSSSSANAWGIRKEETITPAIVTVSSPVSASRFLQASAVEKVISGRWQTKQGMVNQNFEVEDVYVAESGDSGFKDDDAVLQGRYIERVNLGSLSLSKKPAQSVGTLSPERRQAYQPPIDEPFTEISGNSNQIRPFLPVERPKLNLLPRTQQGQQSHESYAKREKVFGGARPREIVLKERGIDDISLSHNEQSHHTREEIRAESKDHLHESERPELHRNIRWNETRRTNRDPERPQLGRAEAQSWRRPEDPSSTKPTIESTAPATQRFGKAASALELVQAFSRPTGGTAAAPPFSRLAAPAQEIRSDSGWRRINGY